MPDHEIAAAAWLTALARGEAVPGCVHTDAEQPKWPRPWQCSSNALPDPAQACRRRIWLPIFWGGHCRRCMSEARAVAG